MRTLIAIFLLATPALAQKKPAKPAPAPKAQHIDITDGDPIEGTTPQAWGDVIQTIKKSPKPGMIKIREDFNPEMYATALNL
jgi:hypothetical protein